MKVRNKAWKRTLAFNSAIKTKSCLERDKLPCMEYKSHTNLKNVKFLKQCDKRGKKERPWKDFYKHMHLNFFIFILENKYKSDLQIMGYPTAHHFPAQSTSSKFHSLWATNQWAKLPLHRSQSRASTGLTLGSASVRNFKHRKRDHFPPLKNTSINSPTTCISASHPPRDDLTVRNGLTCIS